MTTKPKSRSGTTLTSGQRRKNGFERINLWLTAEEFAAVAVIVAALGLSRPRAIGQALIRLRKIIDRKVK